MSAILIVMFILILACSSNSNQDTQSLPAEEGSVPLLMIGDMWTQSGFEFNGIEFTKTVKIVDEHNINSKECYVAEVTTEPPVIPKAIANIDKESMDVIQIQAVGEVNGKPFSSNKTYTYKYSQPPFPRHVGKTWNKTVIEETSITIMGETDTTTTTENSNYEVEYMEEITVPAGSFNCFRILKYGENNQKLNTYWYSDEAKSHVKEIDHQTGKIRELVSYTIGRRN